MTARASRDRMLNWNRERINKLTTNQNSMNTIATQIVATAVKTAQPFVIH